VFSPSTGGDKGECDLSPDSRGVSGANFSLQGLHEGPILGPMILGHFAVPGIAKQTCFQKEHWALLLLASLMPDLLDKPASIFFGLPGRGMGHSLVLLVVLASFAYVLQWRFRRNTGLLFPGVVMWLSHLVGDLAKPEVLFWPFLGPPAPPPPFDFWEKIYQFYVLRLHPEQFWLEVACLATALSLWVLKVVAPRLPPVAATKRFLCILILCALSFGWNSLSMAESYSIHPVGRVVKTADQSALEVFPEFKDALLGLDGFSHVIVLYWFDRNDTPEERSTLRVHPRGDKRNPLTGVFATRSPMRPNLIGFSVCAIKSLEGNRILIDQIDAFDGTRIIDLKPYIPASDCVPAASVPEWVLRLERR
jgi:tRNA (adenine37-N6)-methyltransferase